MANKRPFSVIAGLMEKRTLALFRMSEIIFSAKKRKIKSHGNMHTKKVLFGSLARCFLH